MNDLTTRVLNAIPAGAYEMNALLSLLRIEETDAVATASVSCERRPVLRINPAFVRRHCRTDEHLFLLVMHELHHVLLGHTRLFPRGTRAHNIAFDAVINAMLVRRFPAEAYRSFFLDFYGAEDGPMRLLAPPAGEEITEPALRRLHHLLYEDEDATSEEVFNAIIDSLAAAGDEATDPATVLLGEHSGEGHDGDDVWGTEGPVDDQFIRAIRAIVEKWPPPESPIRGRSLTDVLTRADVVPDHPAARVLAALRRALVGAATAKRRTVRRAIASRAIQIQDAVPNASDRRAAVVRTAGVQPLLYWRPAESRRGRTGRAQVYIDVSGSMDPYVPLLYGALASLCDYVERDLCLFSTTVNPIRLEDLQRGRVDTTGGTDIGCVIDHALSRRVRKTLIITDGYVGEPTQAQAAAIRRSGLEVRVVLTPEGWRKDLEGIAARMDELPSLTDRRVS